MKQKNRIKWLKIHYMKFKKFCKDQKIISKISNLSTILVVFSSWTAMNKIKSIIDDHKLNHNKLLQWNAHTDPNQNLNCIQEKD